VQQESQLLQPDKEEDEQLSHEQLQAWVKNLTCKCKDVSWVIQHKQHQALAVSKQRTEVVAEVSDAAIRKPETRQFTVAT
jgi:hypothetical protein